MPSAKSHTLQRLVICVLIVLATGASVFAAVRQATLIAGHWEGAITLPTGALGMSVDFTVGGDGKLSATLSIPQQGAKDLPLTGVSLTGRDVAFVLLNVPGDPKFRGTLSADGNKIEGTFTQSGTDMPAVLERKANPELARMPSATWMKSQECAQGV
jgi:hypothetical protein